MAIEFLPGETRSSRKAIRGRATAKVTRPRSLAQRTTRRRRLIRVALVAGILICGGILCGIGMLRSLERGLPDVSGLGGLRTRPATTVVSSDGVVLATIRPLDRQPVSLDSVSPYVLNATIAIEDARFYQHHGIDARGVARALWANLRDGNARGQGASTLTQQLARNLYLSNHKTFSRKIEEMLLARKIEARYTKQQILEAYLNTVYYGNGCYGVEAAARTYFGKSARQLTPGEAALLAGLPQRPAAFAPTLHPAAALHRRDEVLTRMIATGALTAQQADQARQEPLHLAASRPQGAAGWKAPYFVSDVLAQLRAAYGPDYIFSGVRIETSLNWQMQRAAEDALRNRLRHSIANTGAVVMLEPRTGYVRALVGGPDFRLSQFDAVTRGSRQPGSAFKPIVYAAAFDRGVCNLASTYPDHELKYPNGAQDYVVHNYDLTYQGNLSVLDALRRSTNTVAVQVGAQVGFDHIMATAQQLGITSPLSPGLPLALGDSAVRPIDLCSAYAAFAAGGKRYDPAMIVRIVGAAGDVVYADQPADRSHPTVLSARTIDQVNVALREVVTSGTAAGAAAIPDAHGKTGTTSSHRDAWFVGYTGDLAAAVWVAREYRTPATAVGRPQIVRYLPMSDATGGSLCVPIWQEFMRASLQEQRRINRTQASDLRRVNAPATAVLVAMLHTEAQQRARAVQATAAAGAANAAVSPPNGPSTFEPAQDGSAPIVVTAPPDTTPDAANTESVTDEHTVAMPGSNSTEEIQQDGPDTF